MLKRKLLLLYLALFPLYLYANQTIKDQHVAIDWLAPESFSNQESWVGIRFRLDPEWHIYWENPGDSGMAPKFQFSVENAEVGNIQMPYPKRFFVSHLVNLGYEKEVVFFFKLKAQVGKPSVNLKVDLEWLVCKEECIPGFGKLSLSRPIQGNQTHYRPEVLQALNLHQQKLPLASENSSLKLHVSSSIGDQVIVLATSTKDLPESIDVFPFPAEQLSVATPVIERIGSSYQIKMSKLPSFNPNKEFGLVVLTKDIAYQFKNISIQAEEASLDLWSWLFMLALAFLGGVLLNLMPCVFPVLSLKLVALVDKKDLIAKKRDGIFYTLGVLTTFSCLGAALLILRALGESVGWGFQLQSPIVLLGLVTLFWMMALNFLGLYELGGTLMSKAGQLKWKSSFSSGVLSVFIASPCTGPFMGTALGAALTVPSFQAISIFFFLGLGLAFPYLILSFSQSASAWFPRPGIWMDTLKQFLAFPLLATVLWLLWVLGLQKGVDGWFYSCLNLFVISFAIWLFQSKRKLIKGLIAWSMILFSFSWSGWQLQNIDLKAKSNWKEFSEESLNSALDSGRAVFVDFTAAWCITCQVNKKLVLETAEADQLFNQANVLRLRADWTNKDPLISSALARLNRNSVPVYAFYTAKQKDPILLPQILTISHIKDLISLKEEK